ncbi:hypothetical protein ES705_48630 [subsurface metagenome]
MTMKLEKAIEILSVEPETLDFENDPDALDALNLGVEALKVICRIRTTWRPVGPAPLPGETVEKI